MSSSSANTYRVGDYVYFETASTSPFQVRRIEELNKTITGNVEAKVMCFFRRRDLPQSLTFLADRHQSALDEEEGVEKESINSKDKHLLKHRELFLSRQVETLPATLIRGKCSVTLLNETESLQSYLNKDDVFFYSLVYDPQQKTLLADKGEIRVGQRYQAETPKAVLQEGESDGRDLAELETLVWTTEHNLTDKQIDQFLVISRSVGTFARALDCSSSVKQPSLHMSAAAASRDVTLFHAMNTLHKNNYDISKAVSALVPSSGPLLCRDELEEWSASEANLFEEALDKYGKDFNDIRCDYVPWKTAKNIVEYYYMWKTTDRYVQQKRVKAAEAETKLKHVYIPNYNKTNSAGLAGKGLVNGTSTPEPLIPGKPCESCLQTSSVQWYAWTGSSGIQARLCNSCWHYWRKYGGLKVQNKLNDFVVAEAEMDLNKKLKSEEDEIDDTQISERIPGLMQQRFHRCAVAGCAKDFKLKNQLARHYAQAHGFALRTASPRPVMKTRTAFYLHTTPMTRVARRLCGDILKPRHACRSPFWPINGVLVKQECQQLVINKSPEELKRLVTNRKRKIPNAKVSEISFKLGQPDRSTPQWLILTEKSKLPKPIKEAYPKPPKGPDGSLIYERVPEKFAIPPGGMSPSPNPLKKRGHEEMNGIDAPPMKRPAWDGAVSQVTALPHSRDGSPLTIPHMAQNIPLAPTGIPPGVRGVLNHVNGAKAKIATVTRVGSRKQIISWMDAPDDLYFSSTEQSKKLRRTFTPSELRRLARSPCKKSILKTPDPVTITAGTRLLPTPTALSVANLTSSPIPLNLDQTKLVGGWAPISPSETSPQIERR